MTEQQTARFTAVTFDYWNTLLHEPSGALVRGRVPVIRALMSDAGLDRSAEDIVAAHAGAFEVARSSWAADVQYTAVHAARDMAVALGLPIDNDGLVADIARAFSTAGTTTQLEDAPGLKAVLQTLTDNGVVLGIVCDVGLTPSPVLRAHLEARDLLRYFTGWSFSDEVGHYKPNPVIFEHAASSLAIASPTRALHIGDNRRTDIRGAQTAGWTAVRYTRFFDDPSPDEPEGTWVIDDLSHLVAITLG